MLEVAETEQLPVPQAKAGDAAAWDTLFRRYQLPLYVYVFELVHNEQASLDVVQETFISAVRNIGGLRDNEKSGAGSSASLIRNVFNGGGNKVATNPPGGTGRNSG